MKDLTIEEWDVLLCSTGYLPPRNEEELDFFDEMYDDYKSRIVNCHVDVDMILRGACHVVTDYRYVESNNILGQTKVAEDVKHEYSMAARNFDKLPKDVLEKMRRQHNKDNKDE